MPSKAQILANEIINLSEAPTWDLAKVEWSLAEVYFESEPERCLCGHYPIIEICLIRNSRNGNDAIVGNCCVKKFLGLPSDKIFSAIKRVKANSEKSVNTQTLNYAFNKGWINEWEYEFYVNIGSKRVLTEKPLQKKKQINERILRNMSRRN